MNEHARAFAEDAAPWFADEGVALYAYDQRGFGGSPNRGIWAGTRPWLPTPPRPHAWSAPATPACRW